MNQIKSNKTLVALIVISNFSNFINIKGLPAHQVEIMWYLENKSLMQVLSCFANQYCSSLQWTEFNELKRSP